MYTETRRHRGGVNSACLSPRGRGNEGTRGRENLLQQIVISHLRPHALPLSLIYACLTTPGPCIYACLTTPGPSFKRRGAWRGVWRGARGSSREVQGEFGVELEGIGPLLLKEGVGVVRQATRSGVKGSWKGLVPSF